MPYPFVPFITKNLCLSASSLSDFVVEVGTFGYCAHYSGAIGSERVVIPCEKPVKGKAVALFAFEVPNTLSLCEIEVHTSQPGN